MALGCLNFIHLYFLLSPDAHDYQYLSDGDDLLFTPCNFNSLPGRIYVGKYSEDSWRLNEGRGQPKVRDVRMNLRRK